MKILYLEFTQAPSFLKFLAVVGIELYGGENGNSLFFSPHLPVVGSKEESPAGPGRDWARSLGGQGETGQMWSLLTARLGT